MSKRLTMRTDCRGAVPAQGQVPLTVRIMNTSGQHFDRARKPTWRVPVASTAT